MSNFNNQNLNNNQNIQNTNFNNNSNVVNDSKIASEINQIKAIKSLILAISVIALIGTICCICWFYMQLSIIFTHFIHYIDYIDYDTPEYKSYVNTKFVISILIFIGIAINAAFVTLGIITLVKNSKIQIIKISKGLVITSAILALVSIIPLFGLISLSSFIVSLICFFNLKKSLNNLSEQNS